MPKRKLTGEIMCLELNKGNNVWSYVNGCGSFLCELCSKSVKYDEKVRFTANQQCNSEKHKRLLLSSKNVK